MNSMTKNGGASYQILGCLVSAETVLQPNIRVRWLELIERDALRRVGIGLSRRYAEPGQRTSCHGDIP